MRKEEPRREESGAASRVLKLSNLDKPFWPEEGITKGDLLAYYREVAPVLVPHLKDRPFTMKRYPDGWQGNFFFQKDAPKPCRSGSSDVPFTSRRGETREKRMIDCPLVNDELALLWMVNMGCIDMNTWYSRIDKPDRPDWVLFDLDPSADAGFAETVEVALLVKQALDTLGLVSFPKTSGADGMHVLVPIERRHTYDDTRRVRGDRRRRARAHVPRARDDRVDEVEAARRADRREPERRGQDDRVRLLRAAEAGAPVSTPLRWDEVNEELDPAAFTMEVVLERVARYGDLFEGVLTAKQRSSRRSTRCARPATGRRATSALEALDLDLDRRPPDTRSSAVGVGHGSPRDRRRSRRPVVPCFSETRADATLPSSAPDSAFGPEAATGSSIRCSHLRRAPALMDAPDPRAGQGRAPRTARRSHPGRRRVPSCTVSGSSSPGSTGVRRGGSRGTRPGRRSSVHAIANGISSGGWMPASATR